MNLLYVDEAYRGHDLASALMKRAEVFAIKNNLVGITLETWSFQARGFYEKQGYEVYGKIENSPPGETEYYLKKELKKMSTEKLFYREMAKEDFFGLG